MTLFTTLAPAPDTATRTSAAPRDELWTVRQALRHSVGVAVPAQALQAMAPAARAGFGQVRLHRGAAAEAATQALGTPAYTVGQHVFMRGDVAHLGSPLARQVLAHELIHTRQQPVLPATPPEQLPLRRIDRHHASEVEAARQAGAVARPGSRGRGPAAPLARLAAPAVQCFDVPLAGWAGSVDDDSAMSVDIEWKVFDGRGAVVQQGTFANRHDRPSASLAPGAYVVQLIGQVRVLQDTWGSNATNQWSLRTDWRARVDERGAITLSPTVPDVSGGRGDAPWSLDYGEVTGASTTGLSLRLSSTETSSVSYTLGGSLSQGAEVSGEVSGEPGGVGVAGGVGVSGGVSEEASRSSETGVGSTRVENLGLLLELAGTAAPPTARMEVGPVRVAHPPRTIAFRTAEADFSGSQRDELVRQFLALDPTPDGFRARGEGLRLLIEGRASPRGDSDANFALSRRRAEFVAEIARATLPGADVPAPGYLGEAAWAAESGDDSADDGDLATQRVATVRVIDLRAELAP